MTEKELQKQFELLLEQDQHTMPRAGHKGRFYEKLTQSQAKWWQGSLLRVAAVALLLIGLGGTTWTLQNTPEHPESQSFRQAEVYLTTMIESQMETIEKMESPEMEKAFVDTKLQIAKMQEDYEALYKKWEANQGQPFLINAMISNLQMQIDILMNLQTKIDFINAKNYDYETL